MKERYQNTSCSIDPPSEMEERGVESPLLREESALNSISGGFTDKRTGWEGRSALSSTPGGFGCQEDRFYGRRFGTKRKQLCIHEVSTPREMPRLAWEGSGTARIGI